MAVLAAAQLLDELMGRNRNVAPNEKVKELNWEDSEYCKYFMVKFCPHDLFVNTRADLGACSKVHDEEVRKLFQQTKAHRKIHYQEEFIRFCSSMINEVERKIQKGKMRLALSGKNELPSISPAQSQKNQEQINILNERINGLEAEAEQAGTDGNVEQAQGLMKLCDQLKEERDSLRKQIDNGHWSATAELAAAQEKQMEVCQVCGAFLIVGDAQQRIDDHLMGKQHVGFARLKAAVDEITNIVQNTKDERRGGRSSSTNTSNSGGGLTGGLGLGLGLGGLGSGGGGLGSGPPAPPGPDERRAARENERERERDKERERDRDRGERDRDRERERDRDNRERERDREREREQRDRDRDRERRKEKDSDKGRSEHRDKDRHDNEKEKERERERRDRRADRPDNNHRIKQNDDRRERDRNRERDRERERDRDRKHRSDRNFDRNFPFVGGRNRHHPYRR